MADLCIVCNLHLRQRQEVLCCISCHGKQHRTCNSGISREEYRRMRSQGQVVFQCVECVEPTVPYSEVTTTSELPSRLLPDAESTRIVEESINIPIVPHAEPHHPEKESLNDQTSPQDLSTTEAVVTFQVTENTSQRGKRKLVSSDGFSYVVKKENKSGSILWRCSVRNSKTSCSATVHQQGDTFITNSKEHTHASKPGILTAVQMTQRIIETAKDDLFVPAPTIVERVMEEMADPREPEFARPKFSNAVRTANRRRQADRPEEPKDMNFEIDLEFLERHTSSDFYRGEVIVGDHRHLVFASDQQLQHLASAKTWYIDGTFKIVSKPFVQLLSIHFFARSGDDMKQLPGIYVLMPRKRKKDYKQVFARILELMPSPPVTELLVADFEEGMWRAAKSVLRGVRIHGCAFHWGQAVWRHVQELGLQIDYSQRDGVFKFVRKLLALPFLPEEQIPVAFHALKETVTSERLIQLTNYIERTWINGDIWTPSSWTVYRMAVRTNNDVEGWHHRINRRAQKSSLPFYVLVILLYKETASIPTQLKMISEGKLRRYQRKTTRLLQCHINQLWDNYNDGSISASRLLKKCGQIYNGQ